MVNIAEVIDLVDWKNMVTTVLGTLIAILIGGNILIKFFYKKTEIKENQISDRGGFNVNGSVGMIVSAPFARQTTEPEPIKTTSSDSKNPERKQQTKELLKKIGKEKISTVLQEAKLIAIETKDEEMRAWINKELEGYLNDPFQGRMKVWDIQKIGIPEYRRIFTRVQVMFRGGATDNLPYPIYLIHSIKNIEEMIEKYRTPNVRYTVKVTFDSELPLIGGKTADVEVPQQELIRVVTSTEQKLSQFLESKL